MLYGLLGAPERVKMTPPQVVEQRGSPLCVFVQVLQRVKSLFELSPLEKERSQSGLEGVRRASDEGQFEREPSKGSRRHGLSFDACVELSGACTLSERPIGVSQPLSRGQNDGQGGVRVGLQLKRLAHDFLPALELGEGAEAAQSNPRLPGTVAQGFVVGFQRRVCVVFLHGDRGFS